MKKDLYRQLQQKLDQFSLGYPETESGVELKILKKLFSDDDARIFLKLSFMLEPTKKIASRIGMSESEAADVLEDMADRGLLYSLRKGAKTYYAAIPYVHGLIEFQVQRMDRELAEWNQQFHQEKMKSNVGERAGDFLMVVPVNRAVDATLNIASYEDAANILRSKDIIAVAECVCRKMSGVMDESCGKPLEACFMFGSMAQNYIDRGRGRKIGVDEALTILKAAQESGLVTQPASALNPTGMCNCCGDCCGVLRSVAEQPKPAEVVFSNYYARINPDECVSCEKCIDRCQMNAIQVNDDKPSGIDLDRCIGCGLCVSACPTGSLRLEAKDTKDRRVPVKNGEAQMKNILTNRGKIKSLIRQEAQTAYEHNRIAGVLGVYSRLIFRTGRQIFRN